MRPAPVALAGSPRPKTPTRNCKTRFLFFVYCTNERHLRVLWVLGCQHVVLSRLDSESWPRAGNPGRDSRILIAQKYLPLAPHP